MRRRASRRGFLQLSSAGAATAASVGLAGIQGVAPHEAAKSAHSELVKIYD